MGSSVSVSVSASGSGWDGRDCLSCCALRRRSSIGPSTFDAMTTTRPYRKALPLEEARRRLSAGAASQWDPRAIATFLKLLETTPLGQTDPTPLLTQASQTAIAA